MSTDSSSLASIQFSAMNFLALREHSVYELQKKLLSKFDNSALVLQVIHDLKSRDLQSDTRFAEAFVRMRIRQGKGPLKILCELRERKIDSLLAAASVDECSSIWDKLARDVRSKHFGENLILDHKNKAKQQRFLQYRGFSMSQIRNAFHSSAD